MTEIVDAQKVLEDVYSPVISRIYAEANPQASQNSNGIDPSMFNNFTTNAN